MTIELYRARRFKAKIAEDPERVRRRTSFAVIILGSLALWAAIMTCLIAIWP
jgi:hypothetical protein